MRVRQGGNQHDYPRTSHRVPMAAPIDAGLLCTSSLAGQRVGVERLSESTHATRDLEGLPGSLISAFELTHKLLIECGADRYATIAKDGGVVLRHSHHQPKSGNARVELPRPDRRAAYGRCVLGRQTTIQSVSLGRH